MKFGKLTLLAYWLSLSSLTLFPQSANAQEFCPGLESKEVEPPSLTLRTVTLHSFGIEVDIPSNYRAMIFQDGSVEILNPYDFYVSECLARGFYVPGHGRCYEEIKMVDRDYSMSLLEQISFDYAPQKVVKYTNNVLSGYIISNSFTGKILGSDKFVEINAGCDDDLDLNTGALDTFLPNIRRID